MEHDRILVFEPHPDDLCFQVAGSVRKWIAAGAQVFVCTVTTGNNSTFDPAVSSEEIKETMAREHRRALDIIGLPRSNLFAWDYDDLGLDTGRHRLPLLRDMVGLIRRVRPATVVTMDPKNAPNDENSDHVLVARVSFEAAALSPHPHLFPEQFEDPGAAHHFVSRILFYMTPEPDTFIDIEGEPFDTKVRMGLAYPSQLELMITEAKKRLEGLGMQSPLLDAPAETLWPMICEEISKDAAGAAAAAGDGKKLRLAEQFRQHLPGVVEKIKGIFQGDLGFEDT